MSNTKTIALSALIASFVSAIAFFVFGHVSAQVGSYGATAHNPLWTMEELGTPCHISTATTTTCKSTSGAVRRVVLGTGVVSGTVKIYDVAGGSCSGTPGSGLVANITFPLALTNPGSMEFAMSMSNGVCVVTSGATDLTVMVE